MTTVKFIDRAEKNSTMPVIFLVAGVRKIVGGPYLRRVELSECGAFRHNHPMLLLASRMLIDYRIRHFVG